MSRNGSGTYSLPAGNPVVTGTQISSSVFNSTMSDIATALTNSLANDGQTTPTANLPMGNYKLTGLGNGTALTDSAALGQVQSGAVQWLTSVSGTNTITASASPVPSGYAAGQTFRFVSAGANTGAVTLNISSLGAKSITRNGTKALVAGDIPSGAVVEVTYDGTQFQLEAARDFAYDVQSQTFTAYTTGGTSTAYTLTPVPAITSLAENQTFDVEFHTAAGATPTLAISGLTAKSLKYRDSAGTLTAVTSAQVPSGWRSRVTYDGTDYIVREIPTSKIVAGTSVDATHGGANDLTYVDFTGIPSWVNRITVMINGVSTNGTSLLIAQLGDAGGIETSGYLSSAANPSGTIGSSTAGLVFAAVIFAANNYQGQLIISRLTGNTWVCNGNVCVSGSNVHYSAGSKSLSDTLTQLRITTEGGTDKFDGGTINIIYE